MLLKASIRNTDVRVNILILNHLYGVEDVNYSKKFGM